MKARVVASICSSITSSTNCPWFSASWALLPMARNPVAMSCSARLRSSSAGSRSPAICSRTKLVERLVGVERGDHPVAVPPGLGIREVCLAARLGEPRDVEPVPPPALAEAGGGEQPVDCVGKGIGRSDLAGTHRPPRAREAARAGRTSPGARASCDRRLPRGRGLGPRVAARRKRSISPRGQSARFTAGGSDFFGGRNDQNSRPFARSTGGRAVALAASDLGSGAPIFTQASKSATTCVGELRLGRHAKLLRRGSGSRG